MGPPSESLNLEVALGDLGQEISLDFTETITLYQTLINRKLKPALSNRNKASVLCIILNFLEVTL